MLAHSSIPFPAARTRTEARANLSRAPTARISPAILALEFVMDVFERLFLSLSLAATIAYYFSPPQHAPGSARFSLPLVSSGARGPKFCIERLEVTFAFPLKRT